MESVKKAITTGISAKNCTFAESCDLLSELRKGNFRHSDITVEHTYELLKKNKYKLG